jgi:hypothetical protein
MPIGVVKAATAILCTRLRQSLVTLSGKLGDDAKAYQIRAVKRAVEKAKT